MPWKEEARYARQEICDKEGSVLEEVKIEIAKGRLRRKRSQNKTGATA